MRSRELALRIHTGLRRCSIAQATLLSLEPEELSLSLRQRVMLPLCISLNGPEHLISPQAHRGQSSRMQSVNGRDMKLT